MRTPGWLRPACRPDVVRRACIYAIVVGPILIAINHGDRIVDGEVDGIAALKMALTMTVPYLVSTFSSVGAMRA